MSGGGARGAYSVGFVFGIIEVLGLKKEDPNPFNLFVGTSAGAINSSWFAAFANEGDFGGEAVRSEWLHMSLATHLKIRPLNIFSDRSADVGRSLLDPGPFEHSIKERLPWERVQRNFETGHVHGVVFTAVELSSGRTVWFQQMGSGQAINWRDARRTFMPVEIGPEHALASSAIPLVFPPRRINNRYYCDGGVSVKTPISAAIRAGAQKLVVISLRSPDETSVHVEEDTCSPTPVTMLAQVAASSSYDSFSEDVRRLEGINHVVDAIDELDEEPRKKITDALTKKRGAAWRKVPTLSVQPEHDFSELAAHHARSMLKTTSRTNRLLLKTLLRSGRHVPLSFLMFEPCFTNALLELGQQDALERADEIRAFFADEVRS